MHLFRHFQEIPPALRGGVVALGNFDGVHLGHRKVIGTALSVAREYQIPCGVMTFEPHPRAVFNPKMEPFRLTPASIKSHLIEAMGVDFLLMQKFDRSTLLPEPAARSIAILTSSLAFYRYRWRNNSKIPCI